MLLRREPLGFGSGAIQGPLPSRFRPTPADSATRPAEATCRASPPILSLAPPRRSGDDAVLRAYTAAGGLPVMNDWTLHALGYLHDAHDACGADQAHRAHDADAWRRILELTAAAPAGPMLDAIAAAAAAQAPNEARYVRLECGHDRALDVIAFRTAEGLLLLHRPARPHARGLEQLAAVYSALARSRDAVVFTDAGGTLLGTSAPWRALYGFTPEEVLGQNPRVINSRQHPRSYFRDLWLDLTNPKIGTWSGELVNRGKNGDLVTVWQTVTTFRDGEGMISGYLGITRDMTAHRELRDRLANSNRELANDARRHDELLAMTVHDLKSPLHALLGWVDLAGHQAQAGALAEVGPLLARAKDAGRRMELLIHTIVDAQQARIGRFEATPSRLSVRSLVRSEVELHRAYAGRQELRLELSESGPVLPTFGDELRLAEAIANVLANAIKFSPAGGTIRVEHRSDAAGNQEVAIEDDGPGIPPDEREQVFELLYQSRGVATASQRRSSGWGLYIAHEVMLLHDGTIRAEAGSSGGCRMVLRFAPLWRVWRARPWAVAVFDPHETVWPRIAAASSRRHLPVFVAQRPEQLLAIGQHELPNVVIHSGEAALPTDLDGGWQPGSERLQPAILTVAPDDSAQGLRVLAERGPDALTRAAITLLGGSAP